MSAPATYTLPPKLDLSTAAALAGALTEARGAPLVLNAGAVTHLGTPGLQVLLSARKTWAQDGVPLSIENFSDALGEQLVPLGLHQADLEASNDTAETDDAPEIALPPLPPLQPEEG